MSKEQLILQRITEYYINNKDNPVVQSYQDLENAWGEAGIKKMFVFLNRIMVKELSLRQYVIFNNRVDKEKSLAELADVFGISTTLISRIYYNTLELLSKQVETIYFQGLLKQNDNEIDESNNVQLNPFQHDINDIMLDEIGLSDRSVRILKRGLMRYDDCLDPIDFKSLKACTIIQKINSLTNLNMCGAKTVIQIIKAFDNCGFDTLRWKEDLKSNISKYSKPSRDCIRDEFGFD